MVSFRRRTDEATRSVAADEPGSMGPFLMRMGAVSLAGDLVIPDGAAGLIVFAHGSGSSRLSPRNVWVADWLQRAGFATLLFDLLTQEEARDRALVFDIGLLADRLEGAVRWVRERPGPHLPVALFGASTGAAAALVVASRAPEVAAVVSRGGRPDLAGDALERVTVPTLLIVGGRDLDVLELNRAAAVHLRCETSIEVIPGATHLFEEPGALGHVAELSAGWFAAHLGSGWAHEER